MSRVKLAGAVAMAASLIFSLAACGGNSADEAAEKLLESAGGGNVEINSEDGSFSYSDENGSMSVGGNVSVPDNFPSAVPLPQNLGLTLYSATSSGSDFTLSYAMEAGSSWSVTSDKYIVQLKDAGYTQASQYSTGDMSSVSLENGSYNVTVMAGPDSIYMEGRPYMNVLVSPSSGSSSSGSTSSGDGGVSMEEDVIISE